MTKEIDTVLIPVVFESSHMTSTPGLMQRLFMMFSCKKRATMEIESIQLCQRTLKRTSLSFPHHHAITKHLPV